MTTLSSTKIERSAADPVLATAPHRVTKVTLVVRDLDRVAAFYRDVIGLAETGREPGALSLGTDAATLVELRHDAAARLRSPRDAGLFHTAFLLPERADLGAWLSQAAARGVSIQGASDHFVSEALYLRDPEGNGIEIYRDRPRGEWRWNGDEVEMGTVPLDLQAVVDAAAADAVTERQVPPGTTMGHVHLSIADLDAAEPFYREVLGLDLTVRYERQATFLSWGGYHHHLGMNVWGGHGLIAPPPGVTGLRTFEIVVPDDAGRAALLARAAAADAVLAEEDGVAVLRDPSGLLARVRA